MVSSRLHPFRVALVVLLAAMMLPASALARERLKVLVPEKDNLQYLVFWVAKASGAFDRQGIDVEIVVAPPAAKGGGGTPPINGMLESGEADAAVLAPPVYLRMIGEKAPIVLVANLFSNDPHGLVVRRDLAEARRLSPSTPLAGRIKGLKDMTIGYPPAAFGRLRALLASQGLDIDKDVKAKPLLARDQKDAFKDKTLDAALLATPHLEHAAVTDAVVVVNLARGELPELANRQTHVLAVSRRTWQERPDVAAGAARAIAEATKLVHEKQGDAVDALDREVPGRDRRALEAIVGLYELGVPATSEVRAEDITPALSLIPEGVPKPDLAGVDLASFIVAPAATRAAAKSGAPKLWLFVALGALALVAITLVVRRRRSSRS